MRRISRLGLIVLAVALLPLCMGTSCNTDVRDAAYGGALDYVGGTTTDSMNSFFPLSQALANLFAGPTGEQDQ